MKTFKLGTLINKKFLADFLNIYTEGNIDRPPKLRKLQEENQHMKNKNL